VGRARTRDCGLEEEERGPGGVRTVAVLRANGDEPGTGGRRRAVPRAGDGARGCGRAAAARGVASARAFRAQTRRVGDADADDRKKGGRKKIKKKC
jgi:hypothetical protein